MRMESQQREGSARGRSHASHTKNLGGYERLATALGGGALLWTGLRRGSWTGLLAGLSGAMLAYRSASGYCPLYARLGIDTSDEALSRGIEVTATVTIDRQPEEVYRFWRDLKNLPTFMDHLHCVASPADGMENRSHWVVREMGLALEWDAEITEDIPGERLAWRSLPGGSLDTEGEVSFQPAPGDLGTEVRVRMRYVPPAKRLAMPLAPLLRRVTRVQMKRELQRLKQLLETGEIATNAMRPQPGQAAQREAGARGREEPLARTQAGQDVQPGQDVQAGQAEKTAQETRRPGEPMQAPSGISREVRP